MGKSDADMDYQTGSEAQLPRVNVRKDESIDRAIRRFKKLCQKENLIKEIRRRERYIKPSEKRRKQLLKSQRKK
jgi:small subunit ribosomal protein S21